MASRSRGETAPPDSRISSNSTWLLPIRIRNALSIIGVSRSSESTWRAGSGGAGALHDGGVAQQRVAIASGERGGDQAAGARAQHVGSIQGVVAAIVGGELASRVH